MDKPPRLMGDIVRSTVIDRLPAEIMADMESGFMEDAWASFVSWAYDQPGIRGEFERDTGFMPLGKAARNNVEKAIDQACGYTPPDDDKIRRYMEVFVLWVTVIHWGREYAPACIKQKIEEIRP